MVNNAGNKVLRCVNNVDFAKAGALPPDSTRFQDKTVQHGVTYRHHIQVYNIAGYSDFVGLNVTTPTQYQACLPKYLAARQMADPTVTSNQAVLNTTAPQIC